MKSIHRVALVLFLASLAGCVKPPLDNIPLVWSPSSQVKFDSVDVSEIVNAKIQVLPFTDTRPQPKLIAENREDTPPKPVTTNDNVGEFVSTHLREVLLSVGLDVVPDNGDVTLSGEVRQFFVVEAATYNGNILLRLALRNRSGAVLWTGTASGSARTFGRSYSAPNYYKVLSDSLVEATARLLQDAEFRRALAHR